MKARPRPDESDGMLRLYSDLGRGRACRLLGSSPFLLFLMRNIGIPQCHWWQNTPYEPVAWHAQGLGEGEMHPMERSRHHAGCMEARGSRALLMQERSRRRAPLDDFSSRIGRWKLDLSRPQRPLAFRTSRLAGGTTVRYISTCICTRISRGDSINDHRDPRARKILID